MNDKNEQVSSGQSESDPQPCCDGGSCCPSGSDGANKSWKIVVFILIVVAAGGVLARSIIRKSDISAEQGQDTFAAIQPVGIQDASQPEAEAKTQDPAAAKSDTETPAVVKEDISDRASPALWGPELDSLALLDKVAAGSDAVFILLAAEDQQGNQAAIKQIEAAARKIQTGGTTISAFRLEQGAPNFANFAEQLSVPSVLAMVKGAGMSAVSADQITEMKLVQAFVAASRPSAGCCPPGSGVSCQ
jgi:hypothetical protein